MQYICFKKIAQQLYVLVLEYFLHRTQKKFWNKIKFKSAVRERDGDYMHK